MTKKNSFFDRVLERLDLLDPSSVQHWISKLIREKGILDTIFQIIQEGVLIVDRDLKIHFVNNAAINILGLPEDIAERDNQTISRYLRDLDWDQLISQDPKESGRITRQEIEIFYPTHRYLQFFLVPYQNENDGSSELELIAIILNDVTEFRDRTESQIESEKIKTMTILAAGVAHEIGNPLNSLTIHLQLLQRYFAELDGENEKAEDAKQLLTVASQEVDRLDTIINQFVKAVRPADMDLKRVSLNELVSETITFMGKEIEDRGIYVEGTWSKGIPPIWGDETQLKQAFYNIIKNAIQAMSKDGLLKISLADKNDCISLSFEDNGKGIDPDDLGNIFNPYYTTREDGSGLGLMIVERIIRNHGGELSVESDPGSGTTVTIKFIPRDRRNRLLNSPRPKVPKIG